jgi:phage I-like protein
VLSRRQTLTIALAGNEPPTEFRLFVSGWNDTENGRYLFDDAAAQATMSAYAKWGVDLAIDLEHQMLEPGIPVEPTAKDARGWCKLELREDGSLWAVNVTWTADGQSRLTEKRQRYVSPAFSVDPETSRVIAIVNVAITAIPATHDTPALMAASRLFDAFTKKLASGDKGMTLEEFAKVCKVLAFETSMSVEDALAQIKGEEKAEEPAEEAPVEEAPAAELAAPPAEEPAPEALAADAEKDEDKEAVMAASARLTRITGKTTIGAAVEEVEVWRKSHLEIEASRASLAKEQAALELGKRKENAVAFTALGAETPHTSGLAKGKLCARLLNEPLDEQTARLAALLSAKGGKLPAAPVPPVSDNTHGLSERELAMCKAKNLDPAKYAATRAGIKARSTNGTGV